MKQSYKVAALCREWFFPSFCALCGKVLLEAREAERGLCSCCLEYMTIQDFPFCTGCGRPLISESGLCMACREKSKPEYEAVLALYPYAGDMGRLLKAYKFGPVRSLALLFAESLCQGVQRLSSLYGPFDVMTPVPARKGKIHEKGWDQMDCIANILETRGGLTVQKSLYRHPSRSQKELNRVERAANLQGKITCIQKPAARVLLFDDVITTGSTLRICAAALRAAGSSSVHAVALFYD